jgi:hypothetical protein
VWLVACNSEEKRPVNYELIRSIEKRKNNPVNIHAVDSAVRLLENGDIVVRTGNDMTSYMLRQLNHFEKTYSHCGIVLIEDGYPFVYHSIGGEDNPDQVLRRDSASFWFSPGHNLSFGIVRLDRSAEMDSGLHKLVSRYYREKKKFDMDFDIRTDDRFYCAEFVYKSVNRAANDSNFIKPVTVMGYTFVGIDNLYLNDHARFVCRIQFM